ncbi:glucose-1-phosphate cytidylyltransferase [Azospirillum tabaci]|uniref:glucose-1-phosphate cytidylyltransferase n=1 Tax=Azospirillum tabaci TaxID=2752310 RepID=UPI0016608FC1|nr:glucose-1-phosphate cytidylyltransferase [Azospirillum tabaci]
MKAVILAGGYGTRMSEETTVRPKPLVEVGDRPILWHIMKIYSSHGINDFIVCLGYKGYLIKEYFVNYLLHTSDVTVDVANRRVELRHNAAESWRVTLVDTGIDTLTGGRIRRIRPHVEEEGDGTFCLTYGDGVADIDIAASVQFHKAHGRLATVAAVRPPARFGAMALEGDSVLRFEEKPPGDRAWINGGFFVLNSRAIDYIDGDDVWWEREPLERLAADDELRAFRHEGFWQPMDTLRDRNALEAQWKSGKAPWKVW